MNFKKMHGAGNDFVILDFRAKQTEGLFADNSSPETLPPERIKHICDRNFGVGCDQLVVLKPSDKADIRAIFYNADGSESGACGNASRCVADIYMQEQGAESCTIETGGGVLQATRAGDNLVTVNMSEPKLDWQQIPLAEERDTLMLFLDESAKSPAVAVGMGNPHCVIFVDDVESFPVERAGEKIEHHPLFPERTNVEFVQHIEGNIFRQRTWERGVGETLACGSGACAVGVAAIRRGLVDGREVQIHLNGGTLIIEWRESDNCVYMTGPVAYVFDGKIL